MQHLPDPAICSIIQRARPRCIPGTNRYAQVCRKWRDASRHEEGDEQLQLLLDLDNLPEADLGSCLAWLQQHGGCVTGVEVSGAICWYVLEHLLITPGIFRAHVTRLELLGPVCSLVALAPHLQQLPRLQHLTADIIYTEQQQGGPDGGGQDTVHPNLCQLCPQLVSLQVYVLVESFEWPHTPLPHAWLTCLLPLGLQQLAIGGKGVDCAHLTHLTALRQLTIKGDSRDLLELLGMTRLQQLELTGELPAAVVVDLVPLASKLVGLRCREWCPATTLSQLTKLTVLTWSAPLAQLEAVPEANWPPEVNPLFSLTSLRRLTIEQLGQDNSWMLEGLCSLGSLRSLRLYGEITGEVLDLVGQVTQLTSLQLPGGAGAPPDLHRKQAQMVQQLTGLVRLTIDQAWLLACGRDLEPLQHLKQLVVVQDGGGHPLDPSALAGPLQPRPASLQHVVYVAHGPDRSRVEVVPSPLPGVRVTAAYRCRPLEEVGHGLRCLRLCPHLPPGVFELVPQGC